MYMDTGNKQGEMELLERYGIQDTREVVRERARNLIEINEDLLESFLAVARVNSDGCYGVHGFDALRFAWYWGLSVYLDCERLWITPREDYERGLHHIVEWELDVVDGVAGRVAVSIAVEDLMQAVHADVYSLFPDCR